MADEEREQNAEAAADEMESDADEMERRAEELGDEVGATRKEWEEKRHDESVPGAPPPPQSEEDRDQA